MFASALRLDGDAAAVVRDKEFYPVNKAIFALFPSSMGDLVLGLLKSSR